LARNARTARKNKKQTERDLALGRARGTPWVPDEKSVNRKATPRRKAKGDGVVAEDEEGMIGHPNAR
jgi:hypothetical protein